MENQNMENNQTQQQDDQGQGNTSERTFTQDEVNRIVGERLARVKAEPSADLMERENRCAQRELQLDAREKLADAGLPKELLGVINCSTKENLDKSIMTLQRLLGASGSGQQGQSRPTYRVSTSIGNQSNGSGFGNRAEDPDEIRKAMGLKG